MTTIKTQLKTLALMFFGFLLICPTTINAQNKAKKIKTYKVWVTMLDHSKENGILYAADEESIKISKNKSLDASNLTVIKAQNIDKIKLRRKGKVGNSAMIGGLSGVALSAIIGVSQNDGFFTKEESAAIAGIFFVPLGSGVGALIGTSSEIIVVNGNLKNYTNWLGTLQRYSLKPNVDE